MVGYIAWSASAKRRDTLAAFGLLGQSNVGLRMPGRLLKSRRSRITVFTPGTICRLMWEDYDRLVGKKPQQPPRPRNLLFTETR